MSWFRHIGIYIISTVIVIGVIAAALYYNLDRSDPPRIQLNPPPKWVSSITWSNDNESIIVIDPVRRAILSYTSDGERSREITISDVFQPGAIQSTENGYLVEEEDGKLIFLDNSFVRMGQINIIGADGDHGILDTLYGWAATKDYLIGHGDFKNRAANDTAADPWKSAIFLISLKEDDPMKYKVLIDIDKTTRLFYTIGNRYFATIGGKGYALAMSEKMEVLEVELAKSKLDEIAPMPILNLSDALETERPTLPLFHAATLQSFFRSVERLAFPTGLFEWRGSLYVAHRRPANTPGATDWYLCEIDIAKKSVAKNIKLPTAARHLSIAPGTTGWVIIEKGSVRGFGNQSIEYMRLVPGSYFR